jgi:hypothetical protein
LARLQKVGAGRLGPARPHAAAGIVVDAPRRGVFCRRWRPAKR